MNSIRTFTIFFLLIISFGCKPKTDLYLERGLDILSNKEKVNFTLINGIKIEEVGVIRDQKEGIKTLIFKMDESTSKDFLSNEEVFFGVRVWIIGEDQKKRIENWDFEPNLIEVENFKYILKPIQIREHQIKKMKIYLYKIENKKKLKIGDSLMLNKVNTYND